MTSVLERLLGSLIRVGSLEVQTASGAPFMVGDGSGPPLAIRFNTRTAELRFLRDPEMELGDLYMDGALSIVRGDLRDVLDLGLRNTATLESSRWMRLINRARLFLRRVQQNNTQLRAKANVSHHYDMDDRLYALFLDADRQYSCAYFENARNTLDDAQLAKKRHIAAKLLVEPGHSVLDVGCGWGGMGLYLAGNCGARVMGVTLSTEQLGVAQARARAQNLGDRADFRLRDYRETQGRFDRIVSVGMFEHVGVGFFDAYFAKIAELLADDGVALIHTITRTDGPGVTNPWITKHIFPGGYIPALSEVLPSIERAGLIATDIEVLQLHYAETLKAWRERFMARRAEAAAIYDERFCRMWEFYLTASEACFRLGQNVNCQFQLAKKVGVVPMTRNYIAERERALRLRDASSADLRMAGE